MTVDVAQFHQVFFEESIEHLANMESGLLELGSDGSDPELINVIFRGAHSIKGGGGTFGFRVVAEYTHLMETLLDRLRAGTMTTNPEIISVLLEAVDVLREMIDAHREGREPDPTQSEPSQLRLQKLLDSPAQEVASGNTSSTSIQMPEEKSLHDWHIKFRPHHHYFKTGNDPYRILRELSALGELGVKADASVLPEFDKLDAEESYLAWDMTLHSSADRSELDEIFAWVEGDCDLDIQDKKQNKNLRMEAPERDTEKPIVESVPVNVTERRTGTDRRSAEGESIRVGIEKIDAIINMVGELVITQSMLSQVGSEVNELNGVAIESLRDGLAQLERNTRELQEGVMRIRMLPISFIFSRFPRLVHDLSQKFGKKVDLKLSGEQTELDKTVMEKIGDPLVHLVRNSLDHGIELPEIRRKAGKPEAGEIHLNAYHQGGNIVIEISDNGAGLNNLRIAEKAKERGLIADDAVLTDDQIMDLIFEPGFSTADIVSDVSGRGVGMDVVKRNIRDLGGTVEVASKEGLGTRFTIRLPLTLAILDGQLVKVGGEIYVIPLVSIVESLQMHADRVNALAGRAEVYRLRNDYIPVMDLHRVLETTGTSTRGSDNLLVVVEGDGKKVGLMVDELLGQQQVVIKSLESNYKQVSGISGATILGDGTVALILDTAKLVNMSCASAGQAGATEDKVIAA